MSTSDLEAVRGRQAVVMQALSSQDHAFFLDHYAEESSRFHESGDLDLRNGFQSEGRSVTRTRYVGGDALGTVTSARSSRPYVLRADHFTGRPGSSVMLPGSGNESVTRRYDSTRVGGVEEAAVIVSCSGRRLRVSTTRRTK